MISYKEQQKSRKLHEFTDPVANYKEMQRNGTISTQHSKIFNLLNDNAPHPCNDLMKLGISQYNARIKELREGKNKLHGNGVRCDIQSFTSKGGSYFLMIDFDVVR